jgi:hypothetical protein
MFLKASLLIKFNSLFDLKLYICQWVSTYFILLLSSISEVGCGCWFHMPIYWSELCVCDARLEMNKKPLALT